MDLTGAPDTLWGREPAALMFLVEAVIIAVIAFGLDLTAAQMGAVLLVANGIIGFIARASVISPASHAAAEILSNDPGCNGD